MLSISDKKKNRPSILTSFNWHLCLDISFLHQLLSLSLYRPLYAVCVCVCVCVYVQTDSSAWVCESFWTIKRTGSKNVICLWIGYTGSAVCLCYSKILKRVFHSWIRLHQMHCMLLIRWKELNKKVICFWTALHRLHCMLLTHVK